MISKRAVCVALALLSLWGGTATAGMFDLPPGSAMLGFSEQTAFPFARGWADLSHFQSHDRHPEHTYHFDVGTIITFYSSERFMIQGLAREIMMSQLHEDGDWLFYPIHQFTDLRLRAGWNIRGGILSLAFLHDCKHDLDGRRGRMTGHDIFELSLTHEPLTGSPLRVVDSSVRGELSAGVYVPPIVQELSPEPHRYRVSALMDVRPVVVPSRLSLLFEGKVTLFERGRESPVYVENRYALDWHLKSGISLPSVSSGATLSVQWERISDDLTLETTKPKNLASIGLHLSAGR